MPDKKNQKVIVLLNFTPADKNVILYGIKIAFIFKKELCLLYNYSKKEKKNYDQLKTRLNEQTNPIKNELPEIKVSTLLLSEHLRDLPEKLSDDYEAIFFVADKYKFSEYSKAVKESPIPFLFVSTDSDVISEFKNLVLPIDLRKENSDSALWSSYFGRFNQTEILVVAANDKNKHFKNQVAKNVVAMKGLFKKFNITHKIFKGRRTSLGNAFEALELALSVNVDCIVILGSSTITPLDLLVGLPEKKLIRRAGELPVLLVNPRRDNYILCD